MPEKNRKMPRAKKPGTRKTAEKKGGKKSAAARSVAPTFAAPIPTGTISPNNAAVITDASGNEHGLGHVYI